MCYITTRNQRYLKKFQKSKEEKNFNKSFLSSFIFSFIQDKKPLGFVPLWDCKVEQNTEREFQNCFEGKKKKKRNEKLQKKKKKERKILFKFRK